MKRITCFIMILAVAVSMTGCGATIPDLSEEQTDLITEYAAGLMVKYNSIPERSLLKDAQLEVEEQKEAEIREKQKKKEEAEKAYLEAQNAEKEEKNDSASEGEAQEVKKDPTIDNLAAFYGLDGFLVSYTGYELCQSYPDEERDDFFLAMEATQGKQLCILKFDVSNTSSEEMDFDMFSKRGVFFLTMEGADRIPVQSTLLLDDLASYKGMIAAGTQEPMILVFEVDESIQQIGTMELTARNGSEKGTMMLQ